MSSEEWTKSRVPIIVRTMTIVLAIMQRFSLVFSAHFVPILRNVHSTAHGNKSTFLTPAGILRETKESSDPAGSVDYWYSMTTERSLTSTPQASMPMAHSSSSLQLFDPWLVPLSLRPNTRVMLVLAAGESVGPFRSRTENMSQMFVVADDQVSRTLRPTPWKSATDVRTSIHRYTHSR